MTPDKELICGCDYGYEGIIFCPMHKAAPELLEACECLTSISITNEDDVKAVVSLAAAVILKAKGETP